MLNSIGLQSWHPGIIRGTAVSSGDWQLLLFWALQKQRYCPSIDTDHSPPPAFPPPLSPIIAAAVKPSGPWRRRGHPILRVTRRAPSSNYELIVQLCKIMRQIWDYAERYELRDWLEITRKITQSRNRVFWGGGCKTCRFSGMPDQMAWSDLILEVAFWWILRMCSKNMAQNPLNFCFEPKFCGCLSFRPCRIEWRVRSETGSSILPLPRMYSANRPKTALTIAFAATNRDI